jgi:hypothetical protein
MLTTHVAAGLRLIVCHYAGEVEADARVDSMFAGLVHQSPSVTISHHQSPSVTISHHHQSPSVIISHHQSSSVIIGHDARVDFDICGSY